MVWEFSSKEQLYVSRGERFGVSNLEPGLCGLFGKNRFCNVHVPFLEGLEFQHPTLNLKVCFSVMGCSLHPVVK